MYSYGEKQTVKERNYELLLHNKYENIRFECNKTVYIFTEIKKSII